MVLGTDWLGANGAAEIQGGDLPVDATVQSKQSKSVGGCSLAKRDRGARATEPRMTAGQATAAGFVWAQRLCARMRAERRGVHGGWPGTMTEARTIVRAAIAAPGVGQTLLTHGDLERLARLTYASARQHWLSCASREPPDRDEREE
ncbi:MAG: hypothetical protein MUF54_10610 [Polyangiaceae bacterium]|jgi:hypothetical protein|nr:hypothetical protein [Polyangiaceae bacterium]